MLSMLTMELLNGVRPHEFLLLRELLKRRCPFRRGILEWLPAEMKLDASERAFRDFVLDAQRLLHHVRQRGRA